MNIFKSLICLDYYNLRLQNRAKEASTSSVHRIGIAWICNILTIIGGYFIYFRLHNQPELVYDKLYEWHYYELAGRVIILVLLTIIYLIAFTVYGDKTTIQSTLKYYVSLPSERQEKIARNASRYFIISFLLFTAVAITLLYLFKIK
ncbi:MAG: hypothetical protein WCH78_10685 [Bacteroidota bacterium]